VPERDLPVRLPHIEEWLPGEDGRSPLANVPEFVHTTCPECGGPARRETDTLDGFACSSWYFLRFISPHYQAGPFEPAALDQWGPPDLYVGGAEHAVMHLLYARFWTKVMADAGIIPFREPFPVLRSQGVMHARDPESGEVRRMSKSRGNVVTPDEVAETHGADALRIYLLFMAPFENNTVWEEDGIVGAKRFLQRFWQLAVDAAGTQQPRQRSAGRTTRRLHQTIKRVTEDIQEFKFNTAVAALMECLNEMGAHHHKYGITTELVDVTRSFVLLIAPFAPHLAEELWEALGETYSVHQQAWPKWDEAWVVEERITLVVQINGKVRDRISAPVDLEDEEATALALHSAAVQRYLDGRSPRRIIIVPNKLVNIVI
jgi:leucyl-tRNA synthetase